MNRRLIFLTFLIFGLSPAILAQNDNMYPTSSGRSEIPDPLPLPDFPYVDGEILYQEIFEFDADQTTLYGIALKYVSDYYKSAKAVLDVTDPASGLIIVKGNFNYASDFYFQFFGTNKSETFYTTGHTLKLEVKDNKIRVSINNLHMILTSMVSSTVDTPVDQLIDEYLEYEMIKKAKKREQIDQVNRSELLKDMDLYAQAFLMELSPYFDRQLKDDW